MVIIDTDILIAAIRGNAIAEKLLSKYKRELAISAITAAELYVGANNPTKKKLVEEILKEHTVIMINKAITETTLRLVKEYNTRSNRLLMPDALIAATCLEYNASLITFNTKDFKFVKGLKLAK